ncbi:MAG: cupin domain-containing protein [Betaproteobacteria bacterium]|nr:cupin domain-containing protein [Betaproteobacteria bacterium]
MSLEIRRVVTGHDAAGRAVIQIDDIAANVTSRRAGQEAVVVWTTNGYPVDNADDADGAARPVGTSQTDGTIFRIVRYEPGVSPRNHRSESIDYAVVMSGEIDMQLDDATVHLKAGDVLVQRGTVHNWQNHGSVPCVMAFVLIGAKPVVRGGKTLGDAELAAP